MRSDINYCKFKFFSSNSCVIVKTHLSYNPEGLQRESSSLLLNPKLPLGEYYGKINGK